MTAYQLALGLCVLWMGLGLWLAIARHVSGQFYVWSLVACALLTGLTNPDW